MKKKRVSPFAIILILFALIVVPSAVGYFIFQSNAHSSYEGSISNPSVDSFDFIVFRKNDLFYEKLSVLKVNNSAIYDCAGNTGEDICYSLTFNGDSYSVFNIKNLSPDTKYSVTMTDKFRRSLSLADYPVENIYSTPSLLKTTPVISRVYGRILNKDGDPVTLALVQITSTSDAEVPMYSAITTSDDGSYQISYTPVKSGFNLQEFTVTTNDGFVTRYRTSSNNNKPVADIVVDWPSVAQSSNLSLVKPSYAGNSCVVGTDQGGVRAQCDLDVDWRVDLNPNNCPHPEKFRLGLIKHTTTTQFHNPAGVKMKLVEQGTETVVAEVTNGGYVNTALLAQGKTYLVKAYEGSKECINNDYNPVKIELAPKTETYPVVKVSPTTQQVNLCRKAGENFGVQYEVPVDAMQSAVSKRMSWAEALVTDYDQITTSYKETVIKGQNVGVTPILRICYKNTCNIENGKQYADSVVQTYTELLNEGNLPQRGLYVHAGHNEPNNGEYRDPDSEAQFVADFMNELVDKGFLSTNPDDAGIKVLSPNFDLFRNGDGQWPGCTNGECDDPTPHPIYTAQSYIALMLQNNDFASQKGNIYAWAVNDYVVDRGLAVPDDVNGFKDFVSRNGMTRNIFITELGKFDQNTSWDDFEGMMSTLEKDPDIGAILMFNSIGLNRDIAFEYHKDLWDGKVNTSDLYGDCERANFNIPQEGSVSALVDENSNVFSGTAKVNASPIPVNSAGSTRETLYALTDSSDSYGLVLGASTEALEPGEYKVTSDSYVLGRDNLAIFEPGQEVKAFFDDNNNGVWDDGEKELDDLSSLNVERVADVGVIELKPGLNFITMPLYTDDLSTAIKMLDEINAQGGYATAVGTYSNSQGKIGWNVVNKRGSTEYGDDLNLQPGQGIFVSVSKAVSLGMRGSDFREPVDVYLRKGWNLTALSGTQTSYSASEVLQELNEKTKVKVSMVAIWDASKGRFETYVINEGLDGRPEIFGSDFDIPDSQAFFVFVDSGVDYWSPEL